jgi:hypothetical protein
MTIHTVRSARAALLALATLAGGRLTAQQIMPPIQPLGPVENTSKDLLGAVSAVRALPGGRVLVNDNGGRKLVLFDPTLSQFTVIADTTSATANAYSSRAAGLIPYKGDSSLFVDPTSLSMLVIDGGGKIVRVIAVPRSNDAQALIGGQAGFPGFDAQGRLVYRGPPQLRAPKVGADGVFAPPEFPDSAAIVRIDLATRKLDTVAFMKIPKIKMNVAQDANGRMSISSIMNPMPITDDWAVLSDGSVVILRGQDYHVDWIRADGKLVSSPKVPFAWRHLDDSSKVAFIDSTRVAMERLREQNNAQRAANGGIGPVMMGSDGGGGGRGGDMVRIEMKAGATGGGGDGPRTPTPAGGAAAPNFTIPPLTFVSPSELPDYAPPFTAGSARGDLDGNLWVRTSNVVNGGSVYDVINGKGDLIDRVVLPSGRVIAGFGPGGIVYMGVREATGARLEQARRKMKIAY